MRIYPYPASASRAATASDCDSDFQELLERFDLLQQRCSELLEDLRVLRHGNGKIRHGQIDATDLEKLAEQEELIEVRMDVLSITPVADYGWLLEDTEIALEEFSALISKLTFEHNARPSLKASGA